MLGSSAQTIIPTSRCCLKFWKLCSDHQRNGRFQCYGNYRPISHLSFLSKLTERVNKLRLADYLSTNNLLNSFQSAYSKHHSTETTLLSVHDHIIEAMRHQQVTCLTLLDLSAAFNTIHHSNLFERLSYPGLAFLLMISLGSNLIY